MNTATANTAAEDTISKLRNFAREGRGIRIECANLVRVNENGDRVVVGGYGLCVASPLGFARGSSMVARCFKREDAERLLAEAHRA